MADEPELVPAIHPGEFIWEDVLVPLNLDVQTAAEKIGLEVGYLQALVEQRASVDVKAAEALGSLAGNGPQLWIALQKLYDQWQAGGIIELYGMASPNVVRIYIALEELGLSYNVHPVDVFAGKQFEADFRKLNPMAKVPVIVDNHGPNGTSCTIFESGAILLYLAEKTGKLLPTNMCAKYETIEWMMVQVTTVGPMFGQLVHFMRFAPPGNDYAKTRYRTQAHRVTEVIDQRLATHPWLSGADYGIADIATYPWICNVPALLGADAVAKYPNAMRWVGVMNERPAVKRALAAVNEVRNLTTASDKADSNNLDKLFGRGQYSAA